MAKARRESVPVIYVEVRRGDRMPETEIHSSVTPRPGEVEWGMGFDFA
ncbi:hypothetical protein ACFLVX_03275 [Chloroflexota bacterium]